METKKVFNNYIYKRSQGADLGKPEGTVQLAWSLVTCRDIIDGTINGSNAQGSDQRLAAPYSPEERVKLLLHGYQGSGVVPELTDQALELLFRDGI